jgi:hypothetical protein
MALIRRGSARIMANCNVKTLVSQTSYRAGYALVGKDPYANDMLNA